MNSFRSTVTDVDDPEKVWRRSIQLANVMSHLCHEIPVIATGFQPMKSLFMDGWRAPSASSPTEGIAIAQFLCPMVTARDGRIVMNRLN